MNTSEEINKYYKLINEYIDVYLNNWKISPVKLKKYLSTSKISNFLEKKGLGKVKNIERIIEDVIHDRISIENDKIMTFESFDINKSRSEISECIHMGIGKSNIEHEKVLADHFDVSLSEIDPLNSDLHQFKINGENFVIFNKEELGIIESNIKDWMVEKILLEKLEISLGEKKIEILISKISEKNLVEKYLSNEIKEVKWIIGTVLKCEIIEDNNYFLGKL